MILTCQNSTAYWWFKSPSSPVWYFVPLGGIMQVWVAVSDDASVWLYLAFQNFGIIFSECVLYLVFFVLARFLLFLKLLVNLISLKIHIFWCFVKWNKSLIRLVQVCNCSVQIKINQHACHLPLMLHPCSFGRMGVCSDTVGYGGNSMCTEMMHCSNLVVTPVREAF